MDQQRPVDHFAVFKLFRLDARNAVFAGKKKAFCLLLLQLDKDRVHQVEKVVPADRLELIVKRLDPVGLHRIFGGGGKKNDFYILVVGSDLRSSIHAIFPRHEDIQKDDVVAHALFNLSDQLDRILKKAICNFFVLGCTIKRQILVERIQYRAVIIAKGYFYHRRKSPYIYDDFIMTYFAQQ